MTAALLSTRIAALEQRAEQGRDARKLEERLMASLAELQHELKATQATILDGEYAERILNHLTTQADRVMAGGAAMRGEEPSASEPAPADDAQTLLTVLKSIGYAVPASALASRLRQGGFNVQRVEAGMAELVSSKQVAQQPDGKYRLPHWSKR